MIYRFLLASVFIFISFNEKKPTRFIEYAVVTKETKLVTPEESVYNALNANSFDIPTFECFSKALQGFHKLKESGKVSKEFLTIVDYSLPSTVKRLWIIDIKTNTVVLNSLVAHGKNSGENFATSFSNKCESNKSSLGFFTTGETYVGKHGLSLKLDGLENGVNNMARTRAIVMHAADYVTENFAKAHRRLGLSHGCPALPPNLSAKIISTIKGKSCLFIYHPSLYNANTSKLVS
jgi:hypothetical protein